MKLSLEHGLIERIRTAQTPEVRAHLIGVLEGVPVDRCPFYYRWQRIYDVGEFQCWTETGYDPSLSQWPRDVQLLGAMEYGKSDIDNGGFHQFFGNGTGIMAPEMAEWCERSSLNELADIIRLGISVFGAQFPRAQSDRRAFLDAIDGSSREEWDPFYELDDRFYACFEPEPRTFDDAADRWLQVVCGIRSLRDLPPGIAIG